MDRKIKIWEDAILKEVDDHLIIHFETPMMNEEVEYCISANIFWKKNKDDCCIPLNLFLYTPQNIDHTFQNGITIKGTVTIQKFGAFHSKDTLGIFADLYYYSNNSNLYIWHTEGFLISFDSQTLIDEEEDSPTIKGDEDSGVVVSPTITSDAFSDLFPYIHLSGWPKISRSEHLFNFFGYSSYQIILPSPSFLNTLGLLKSAQNRKGMQTEAISFIEGKSPYQSRYVKNVHELQGYVGGFQLFYEFWEKEERITDVVTQTCTFFNTEVADFLAYLKSDVYLVNKERLWESYSALVIEMGFENENLISIIEVLTLSNFLELVFQYLDRNQFSTTLDTVKLKSLFHATIILDKNIFPLPPYQPSSPTSPSRVIVPYALGDLQLVKYKLSRYEIGELASITSIMPGEKRKLVNRKLDRVIDKEITKTLSETTSIAINKERNNDFNEELWNAIAETTETTNYPDPGLVSSYGPPTNITIKGSYTKTHTTQTPDKKQLSSFAKKILNKTTQRLSAKVQKVRAYTQVKESEDISVSVLNNSTSEEPVYGMYCWLNKVYQTEVLNYGNRMLFSFSIAHPAAAYIEQTKTLSGMNFQEPKSLKDFNIATYQDITEDNYLQVSQYYELKKFPLCPQGTIVVSDVIALSQSKLITLPDLYKAEKATVEYAFGSGTVDATVNGFLGENTFTFDQGSESVGILKFNELNNEQTNIGVSVVHAPTIQMSPPNSVVDFQMGVHISCVPLAQTILTWQIEMYQLIQEAYTEKITVYNSKIGESSSKKEKVNPLSERLRVKLELEKGVRKQLLQHAIELNGLSANKINTGGYASLINNQSEVIQYLNTALEWDEMSYTFFDEYDTEKDLFSVSTVSPDFFSAFLKAAYARVIIPISPMLNYGFLYFLNTGIVWTAKDNLAPCLEEVTTTSTANPDQLSVIYGLKKTFWQSRMIPKVIDSWEVLIPTSMQILQHRKHLKIKNYE